MPAATRQRVPVFPSPDLRDLLFWERDTLSRADYTDLESDPKRDYGTAHPDTTKFPNHVLCYWEADPDFQTGNDGQDSLRVRKYYVANRADQDNYNFAFVSADIGGQKFDAVQRTYVIPRASWAEATPAPGAAMPTDPSGKFPAGYILASRRQTSTGSKEIDSLYVTEVRTYIKRVATSSIDYDEFFQNHNLTTETLYYTGETPSGAGDTIDNLIEDPDNAFWDLTTDGYVSTGKQLSAKWFLVTTQQVVNTEGGGGSFSYETSVNYSFPSVLSSIATDVWERRSGGLEPYSRPVYSKHGYSGPCRAVVSVSWSKAAPSIPALSAPPRPLPISYASPIASISIPPSLHAAFNVSLTNGTSDKVYVYTAGTYSFPATNYTDWPSSLIVKASSKPFRGGWLLETVTVYSPT